VVNTIVENVPRNPDGSNWQLKLNKLGELKTESFDKVVFAHGYQTKPKMPQFEGQELFQGPLIHAQQYRKPDDFKGKRVVIVGIGAITSDIATELVAHASKLYISHRRGMIIASRWRNGFPGDMSITRSRAKWIYRRYEHNLVEETSKLIHDPALSEFFEKAG
jgi:dimethylaniline monooxygenase (N-oxide forming)